MPAELGEFDQRLAQKTSTIVAIIAEPRVLATMLGIADQTNRPVAVTDRLADIDLVKILPDGQIRQTALGKESLAAVLDYSLAIEEILLSHWQGMFEAHIGQAAARSMLPQIYNPAFLPRARVNPFACQIIQTGAAIDQAGNLNYLASADGEWQRFNNRPDLEDDLGRLCGFGLAEKNKAGDYRILKFGRLVNQLNIKCLKWVAQASFDSFLLGNTDI